MILYDGQLKDYEFNRERKRSHHKDKEGKYRTEIYCNNIVTFDIECSSAWLDEDGNIITYEKGKPEKYWNDMQAMALCYLWQCSVDGTVYYGRELETFRDLLSDLPDDMHMIIWVHNLAYEFQFLCNIVTWEKVFARAPRKPIKASCSEYPLIEFRCTYYLTRLSLESWGKQLGVHKAVGDLDYDILRTPLTPLTDAELHYGEQDCLVVEAGIKDYLKKYKKLRNIPLTQTGTVRREVKDMLTCDKQYVRFIKKLVPRSAAEYARLKRVFSGGYTHANQLYSNKKVEELIEHYDFASSYPAVMLAEKYPMSGWYYNGVNVIPPDEDFEDMAFIFYLEFKNIDSISFNTYIQASRATGTGFRFDNGRILHADTLELYITEQDWITIRNNYEWEYMNVRRVWRCKKDYLPVPFLKYVLELYKNKTSLKNVAGYEDLYLQSKQYINSLFGMMVTALMQADVVYQDGDWHIKELTKKDVEKKLKKLADYHDREKRYFLSYSWGCWVTAYARRNLWKCMEKYDREVLYVDTDSIFLRGKHDFSFYNAEITEKLRRSCEHNGLDFEDTRPCTPKGIHKPLGIFEKEENCTEFKTLGAKKYVERREGDGKLHLTVSGINKGAVELLQDDIDNFRDGFNFDKDADCVTKKQHTYITQMPDAVYPDGYVSRYRYGINLRNNGYLLGLTDEYTALLKFMEYYIDDIPEAFINHLRGTWRNTDG